MDLMREPGWREIVKALYEDQGDLAVPDEFEIDVDSWNAMLAPYGATLAQLGGYVATLSLEDLQALAWSDLHDECEGGGARLIAAAGDLGPGLHFAVDEIYMTVAGG